MKKAALILAIIFMAAGCVAKNPQIRQREVLIRVEAADPAKVSVHNGDKVNKSMEVHNPEGSLCELSFISNNKAFSKIFSKLTIGDVLKMWNDIVVLNETTEIRELNIFINSPGGDAFSGLAIADQIERAKRMGFKVTAHASGIVASAAVPVFAVCDRRLAAPGTIFMVHETSIWKWPGRETASDIRSQHELLNLLRDRYIGKLAKYSKLSKEKWEKLEYKTTWFSVEKAVEWGLVDAIE